MGKSKQDVYIAKRKRKAFFESLAYYVCRIFPIDKNKVVMWTFEGGGGYGCSPKYVAEELLRRNKEDGKSYKIVWLLKDMEKEFPPEIKKVKDTLWHRAFHFTTSGIWVSNTRTFYGTKKRKKQIYIQTWHQTIGIKPIGKYRGEKFPKIAEIVSEADSKLIDYVLSGSDWCDHMYRDGLLYDGKIIRTGTPRCDVLLNKKEEMRKKYRQLYNIPANARIILYAPTFRGGSQQQSRAINLEKSTVNFERLISALETRFGGVWYVFLRLHPQLAAEMMSFSVKNRMNQMIDVSQLPDINEIIAGADAFLTDYSSAIYEGAIAGLPCFIYADDLEKYVADRGTLMFDIYKLPFPVALNNDELSNKILSFDEEKYKKDWAAFVDETGIVEDGHASKRVADLIDASRQKLFGK